MGTNSILPENWQRFRDRLCALIEDRRVVASSYTYREVYLFISNCRTAFASPGTDKAEQALDAIVENGTFRLVAESRSDFLAMFPVARPPEDGVGQLQEERQQAGAYDQTRRRPEVAKLGGSGSGQDPGRKPQDRSYPSRPSSPSPIRRPAYEGEQDSPLPARRRSGRPF